MRHFRISVTVEGGGGSRRRPPYFKTKKLALLGNTANLSYAPWFDPTWTLAAHPCVERKCKRTPDWYFDLHPPETFRAKKTWRNRDHYTWLKQLTVPIFMQQDYPDIPMAVKFPKTRLLAEFRPYFTNHCAWMIALAMTEGITHIGLFGCQYKADTEHGTQRDSLTYWLGRFEQAGGTLVIPDDDNTLLCSPKELYGYESHANHGDLVASYRTKKVVTIPKADGTAERRELASVNTDTGQCAVPLMPPPNGEPIAWERSGLPGGA